MIYFTIAFFIIIILIIFKPKKINEAIISLLGLIVLILFGLIQFSDVPQSLFGSDFFQPIKIVIILISLAIISTTLDDYGFFRYIAHKAILWSKNNGQLLFRNFFILTIVLTSFTSNDVDILTITPIVLWFALITKINPIPYLFVTFVAANTSSMEFLIGNLTNIVIGNIFGLGFVEFFLIMVIPTIVTLFVQYFILKLLFRKQLPDKLVPQEKLEEVNKEIQKPLINRKKNYFVLIILGLVILGSALSDFLPFELWMVTTVGALILLSSFQFNLIKRLKSIPWNVVIFALTFIILTGKLQSFGIIGKLTSFFSGAMSDVWSSVFTSGFLSGMLSGLINNIPASISLSSLFHLLTLNASDIITKASAYGLVVGTNIGALLTPVGALATILWITLIRNKGFKFPMKKFITYGLIIGFVSIGVSCTIIAIELLLFF
ncbi:MAG: SLC13 family permease [Candidatus Kerfeldbacteria bacterium]|jgi:arsenical pump membrane protein